LGDLIDRCPFGVFPLGKCRPQASPSLPEAGEVGLKAEDDVDHFIKGFWLVPQQCFWGSVCGIEEPIKKQ